MDARVGMGRHRTAAAFALACAVCAAPATAQEDRDSAAVAAASGVPSAAGGPRGWRGQWGAGLIANPKFVGGDAYNLTPIPYLDFRYYDERGTRLFANIPQGLGGYFLRRRASQGRRFLNLGAALAPGFNVRDDSIDGLQEVDPAAELRLYLEAGTGPWVGSATLAQDVGSGHEGAYADLALSYRGQVGGRGGFFAAGPVLRIGDDDYKGALFGVTAAESAASGLPAFTPDAGVERAGLQGLLSMPLGASPWRWTAIVRGSRLMSDAADSPVTADATQWFFLTSFTRAF